MTNRSSSLFQNVRAWAAPATSLPDEAAFLQERVAVYARTLFFLLSAFLALRVVVYGAAPDEGDWLGGASLVFHVVAVVMLLASWLGTRRLTAAPHLAAVIEGLGTVALGLTAGAAAATAPTPLRPEQLATTATLIILMLRAALVPSSPGRTGLVSFLSVLPIVATSVVLTYTRRPIEGLPFRELRFLPVLAWGVAGVAVAVIVSRVVYRLTIEVQEARRVGQYQLVRKLGEGGMGEVYEARHALLRRPTAVKLLPRSKAGEQSISRFEKEVQSTSLLTHPNTVAIYDYGRTPDGTFYYAMEYLEGPTLERLVQEEGPQPAARVAHVLRQVAAALEEAHGRGLVHRDIKPANIALCERGGIPDTVKVLDFGLVKDASLAADPEPTREDMVVGTPHYLAPETIRGDEEPGPSVDLYALGAVGWYLLTGQRVFEEPTVAAVCAAHLHTAPEPPSRHTEEPVPEELDAIVLACLAKRPEGRPKSAAALAEALAGLAKGWTRDAARLRQEAWRAAAAKATLAEAGDAESPEGALTVDLRKGR